MASEAFTIHAKFFGAIATAFGVVGVAVMQVTASSVHAKAELGRVEELTKHEARVAKVEARRLEEYLIHEVAQREEMMLRQAAQSEAAHQKTEADVFRVLAGAEHQGAVEMTRKNVRAAVQAAKDM